MKRSLELLRYNNLLQKRFDKDIYDYKHFTSTEIELILENKPGKFININNNNESYINIYINDDKKETKMSQIKESDKTKRVKIMINKKLKSYNGLFMGCKNFEKINIIK